MELHDRFGNLREWKVGGRVVTVDGVPPITPTVRVVEGGSTIIAEVYGSTIDEAFAGARTVARAPRMEAALLIIHECPEIRAWLAVHDPKALEQVRDALGLAAEVKGGEVV